MRKEKALVPDGWFKWERPNIDFPFYNDASRPTWHAFLLIGSSLIVVVGLNVITFEGRLGTCIFTVLATLVPFLIVARGNLGTIIKKPRLGDIPLALITLVLGIAYALIMGAILTQVLGMQMASDAAINETMDAPFYVVVAVQLVGEELVKINMFLGILMLVYRYMDKRKMGIVLATFVSVILFGIAHMHAYSGAFLQILLIQGLGSIFCMFCYLKSKNILVSYANHLLNDFFSFGLSAAGFGATSLLIGMPLF